MCFCVRYKVFSVYCTLSQTEKSSVNKWDFRLKWDLMWQKPLKKFKLNFYIIQFGSIRFKGFCHLFIKLCQKRTFFLGPFTSDFADSMSIILAIFVFVRIYMKRTAPKIVFVVVLSQILSRTPSPFSGKV